MTVSLPYEQGIADMIMDAMVGLLTLKLKTEIPLTDASRLVVIKTGPRQDDPDGVVVLVHENDPDSPKQWPHRPVRYKTPRKTGGFIGGPFDEVQSELRTLSGYELVGGGSQMAYAFTVEFEVWGDELADVSAERYDVRHLASMVENRIRKSLQDAGPKVGTGKLVADSFGNTTQRGPFFGDSWVDQEAGEALIGRRYIQLYYICTVAWDTSEY